MAVKKLSAQGCYIMEACAPVASNLAAGMPAPSPNSEAGMAAAEGATVVVIDSQPPPPAPMAPAPLTILDRPGILVHEGDFDSSDGPIAFNEARLRRVARHMNELRDLLISDYKGCVPDGAWHSLLDGHDDAKNSDIIGRLMGGYRVEKRDVPKVGKGLWCLINDQLRFLGADTCQRVLDGRIFNLSVGIDENTDLITEVSTVIVPAALGAHVLSAKKKSTTPLVPTPNLLKNDPKGASMPKSLVKRLAAAKARQSALKQLVADSEGVTQLAAGHKTKIVHMVAEAGVTKRLRGLVASGKMTPAELKGMDVKKLAALDKSALDVCLGAMEAREPVIQPGQIGSKEAVDGTQVRANLEKTQIKRLKAEIRSDMRLKVSGGATKHLKAGEKAEKFKEGDEEKDLGAGGDEKDADKKELSIDEKVDKKMAGGDENADKKDLAGAEDVTKALASGEDYERALLSLQEQMDAQSIQIAKIGDAVKKMLVAEEAEVADMEAEEQAGAAGAAELDADGNPIKKELGAGAGDNPADKKELAAPAAPEDKKDLAAGADGAEKKEGEEKKPGDKKE